MGWVEQKPWPHTCHPPEVADLPVDAGPGSIWECDRCRSRWILRGSSVVAWHHIGKPRTKVRHLF